MEYSMNLTKSKNNIDVVYASTGGYREIIDDINNDNHTKSGFMHKLTSEFCGVVCLGLGTKVVLCSCFVSVKFQYWMGSDA